MVKSKWCFAGGLIVFVRSPVMSLPARQTHHLPPPTGGDVCGIALEDIEVIQHLDVPGILIAQRDLKSVSVPLAAVATGGLALSANAGEGVFS